MGVDAVGFSEKNIQSFNRYAYANNNPYRFVDPTGLYPILVVTLPDGAQYKPQTTVKNSAQAKTLGTPVGTPVPIAVPTGVHPQEMVNSWSSGDMFNGRVEFAWTWRPGGPNDYKLISPIYDAYGNFEYGATGAAVHYTSSELQTAGDLLHKGENSSINKKDIQSGFDAISSGGKLSTEEYTPPK